MLSVGTLLAATLAARIATAAGENVLYSFCAQGGNDCADGKEPLASLIMDEAGNLYGTTRAGGPYGGGTVFRLLHLINTAGAADRVFPRGAAAQWKETVLSGFGKPAGDGFDPYAGLIMDAEGNLYGTTRAGGARGGGTVFQVRP
jgi:uncharacterized repeat protein (TIGR03803 family)